MLVTVVRTPGATAEKSGDRMVVLDAEARQMSTLNFVGGLLWQTLETPHDDVQLVAVLQRAFPEVEEATLQTDVAAFLAQMRTAGLIVDANAAS